MAAVAAVRGISSRLGATLVWRAGGHWIWCLTMRRLSACRVMPRRLAASTMLPPALSAASHNSRSACARLNDSITIGM